MKQLMLLLEESQASKEAKAKGLEYMSFGRYGKKGKVTHKVDKGKLVPISGGEKGKVDFKGKLSGKIANLSKKKADTDAAVQKIAQKQTRNGGYRLTISVRKS